MEQLEDVLVLLVEVTKEWPWRMEYEDVVVLLDEVTEEGP